MTEITTPKLEPYLHSRRLSCAVDDARPGSQANGPNGTSNILPPLISSQPRDHLYRPYHSSLSIHPLQYGQDSSTAPLHHILCQDQPPAKGSSLHSPSPQSPTKIEPQEECGNVLLFPPRQVKRIGQRRDATGPYCHLDIPAAHSLSRPSDQQRPSQSTYAEKTSRDVDAPPPPHGFRGAPESDIVKTEPPGLESRAPSHAFSSAAASRSEGSRPSDGAARDGRVPQQSYPRTTSDENNTNSVESSVKEVQVPPYAFPGPISRSQDPGSMQRPVQDVSQSQGSLSGTRNGGTRAMEIPGIISDSRPPYAFTSSSVASSTNVPSPQSSHGPKYVISLRQQPLAARACGFGDRDRRAVDPPPILQMTIDDPRASPQEIKAGLRYPYFVVHCELWNADEDHAETAMPEVNDRPHQRRLMGTVVASPFVGQDENDVEGCFFCFPDLSCRTSGSYRLRFVLLILDPSNMKPGDRSPFRAMAMSQVFRVFAAKDFPGMQESTPLTKALKAQGCLISVKKGNNRTRPSHGRGENDDDDEGDEEEEGESPGNPRKRQKK